MGRRRGGGGGEVGRGEIRYRAKAEETHHEADSRSQINVVWALHQAE